MNLLLKSTQNKMSEDKKGEQMSINEEKMS